MARVDGGRLPPDGVHLDGQELAVVIHAVRALIGGTDPHDPNRAHVLAIAVVVADAVERRRGSP